MPVTEFLGYMKYMRVLLILLTLASFKTHATPQTITIALTDKDNFPYELGHGKKLDSQKPGLSIEMLQMIERDIPNIKFRFVRLKWVSCLAELIYGHVDAAFELSYLPERQKLGQYPMIGQKANKDLAMYQDRSYSLFARKDSHIQWDGHDISGQTKSIGIADGAALSRRLKKLGIQYENNESDIINFTKVLHNKIEGVAVLTLTGDYYMENMPHAKYKLEKLSPPLFSKPYYLVFSHHFYESNPETANQIWLKIKEVRESKEFNRRIFQYYPTVKNLTIAHYPGD